MITDQESNLIYFSERLAQRYPKLYKDIQKILEHKAIRYGLLPHTKDIWCRDYMPVQVSKNEFIQFRYDPTYLKSKKYNKTRTDAVKACSVINIEPVISDIRIDGGNIVRSRNKVVLTERIFKENRRYNKYSLLRKIKKLLKVEQVIIVPECSYDICGHADGMIRFVDGVKDEDTVLVSDFSQESPKFFSKFHRVLSKEGLNSVLLPYAVYRNKDDDATGIYVNYLQVGKTVIYPIYGIKEDKLAEKVFSRCFGTNAIPLKANEIAKKGGVLNCVSWNIKKEG